MSFVYAACFQMLYTFMLQYTVVDSSKTHLPNIMRFNVQRTATVPRLRNECCEYTRTKEKQYDLPNSSSHVLLAQYQGLQWNPYLYRIITATSLARYGTADTTREGKERSYITIRRDYILSLYRIYYLCQRLLLCPISISATTHRVAFFPPSPRLCC